MCLPAVQVCKEFGIATLPPHMQVNTALQQLQQAVPENEEELLTDEQEAAMVGGW